MFILRDAYLKKTNWNNFYSHLLAPKAAVHKRSVKLLFHRKRLVSESYCSKASKKNSSIVVRSYYSKVE